MTTTTIAAMISRHRDLYRLTDEMYEAGGDAATDTSEYRSAIEETINLEHRIVASRVRCRADLVAKFKFVTKTNFVGEGDLDRLVVALLQLDVEAIGESLPALEAEGIRAQQTST